MLVHTNYYTLPNKSGVYEIMAGTSTGQCFVYKVGFYGKVPCHLGAAFWCEEKDLKKTTVFNFNDK